VNEVIVTEVLSLSADIIAEITESVTFSINSMLSPKIDTLLVFLSLVTAMLIANLCLKIYKR